jgi:hypothetical protein
LPDLCVCVCVFFARLWIFRDNSYCVNHQHFLAYRRSSLSPQWNVYDLDCLSVRRGHSCGR